MKTELLAEKTALVMQNKNGGFRDLYGSLSTVHCSDKIILGAQVEAKKVPIIP